MRLSTHFSSGLFLLSRDSLRITSAAIAPVIVFKEGFFVSVKQRLPISSIIALSLDCSGTVSALTPKPLRPGCASSFLLAARSLPLWKIHDSIFWRHIAEQAGLLNVLMSHSRPPVLWWGLFWSFVVHHCVPSKRSSTTSSQFIAALTFHWTTATG